MANTAVKISALPTATSLVGNSLIVVVDGATSNTKAITVANFLGNTAANVAVRATRLLSAPPANSTANGISGDISYDASFVYVCTSTNVWKRAALSSY